MNDTIRIESGVRKYLKRSLVQRARQWWMTRNLGSIGVQCFVESPVHFMRHPENIQLGKELIIKSGARLCPTNPQASITIGDATSIGYHTYMFATIVIPVV
ncbi:MAG: hypothetical protein AAFP69_13305, partial [Planctomycetota bacterium]